jgi:hypothetical protein
MLYMQKDRKEITIILTSHQKEYLAYIEELPEISAFGNTLTEAREKIVHELTKHALSTSNDYVINKIKYKISSV